MEDVNALEKRVTTLEKQYQAVFDKEMTLTPEEVELLNRANNGLKNIRKLLVHFIIAEILFLILLALILLLH